MIALFVLFCIGQNSYAQYTPEALADQVKYLPGSENILEKITFNQFSGYLKVGYTKNLHYW